MTAAKGRAQLAELLAAGRAAKLKLRRCPDAYTPQSGIHCWVAAANGSHITLERWTLARDPRREWRLVATGPAGTVHANEWLTVDRVRRLLTALEILPEHPTPEGDPR